MDRVFYLVILNNVNVCRDSKLKSAYKRTAEVISNLQHPSISSEAPLPSYENISKYIKDKSIWHGRINIGLITFQKVVIYGD